MQLLTPDPGFIFWHAVILVVAFALLSKFAWRPILGALRKREQAYEKAAQQLLTAKKKEKELKVMEEEMVKKAHLKSDRIIKEALESREVILESAEKEASQQKKEMIDRALQTIDLEKRAAESLIKKQVVSLVVDTTEKLLGEKMNQEAEQNLLIERMIEDVEQGHNRKQQG